jgi:carboxypeptidase family protein
MQSLNGALSGTITDASGAVIPGAGISLTYVPRQITIETASGSDGLYTFPNLEPGVYELRVSAAHFKPAVQRNLMISVSRPVRSDVPA